MDDLLFEQLNEPYSMEAEQALLGAVLMNPACYTRVSGIVRPESFIFRSTRRFCRHCQFGLFKPKIDPLLVLEELKQNGTYDEAAGKIIWRSWRKACRAWKTSSPTPGLSKKNIICERLWKRRKKCSKTPPTKNFRRTQSWTPPSRKSTISAKATKKTNRCAFPIFCATKCMIICKNHFARNRGRKQRHPHRVFAFG